MRNRTDEVSGDGFVALVLVCTNGRDGEYAACADVGGGAVYEAVKTWLRERDLFWSAVFLAETSCLGLCSENGTAISIQPRNQWYSDVTAGEVPALLDREFRGASGEARSPSPSRNR